MDRQAVFALIVKHCREVVPDLAAHEFCDTDRLVELGANSMERAEIVMMTLEELALEIPRVEAFGPRNIGELADLLYRKFHAR
jgi:polyketide biosynthesis acyl carrier protein